jgi:hypothetical protein
VTRTIGCARGLSPRIHDIIARADGTYWLMCDETRLVDLSGIGGVPAARVTGTAVQRISADGALLFDWSPFDHFDIADSPPRDRAGATVNWTHGNALDLAPDGNLIVSFRNLGEVTKIHAVTGAVLWRLGGPRNAFTFLGDAGVPFVAQHGARMSAPATVLLLDNLGTHGESRAERYALDEQAMTARLVRSYSAAPTVVTEIGGSVQDLPGAVRWSRSARRVGSRSTTPPAAWCGASSPTPATCSGHSASARCTLRGAGRTSPAERHSGAMCARRR